MNKIHKLPVFLPNEIINIIISFRNIHPLSIIVKNEYINTFNKKYKKYLKEMFDDLTNGLNRANHFIYQEDNNDNITIQDYSENNDDNISIYTDIYDNEYNEYYNYENIEEHWAFSNRNATIQFQAMNCVNCGEYKLSSNLFILNNIICNCL
jgi:hypothetical protein